VANGNLTTARNPVKIFLRDWILCLMQLIPSWRRQLELGPRAEGMLTYKYVEGMAFLPDLGGGHALPQVYCRAVYRSSSPDKHDQQQQQPPVQFTDDALYQPAESPSLLRLVVLVDDLAQVAEAQSELARLDLERVSNGELKMQECLFLVHSPSVETPQQPSASAFPSDRVYRVATGDEFLASDLCKNRLSPVGYDMYRMKTDFRGRKYVLVRPDQIVFAACQSAEELTCACERIPGALFGMSSGAHVSTIETPK
jgi:hypothetical protein